MDPVEFQARWRLGDLFDPEIEQAATAWLAAGADGPCLTELAWPRDPKAPTLNLDALIAGALAELGQPVMSEHQSLLWVIRQVAGRIVAGKVAPFEGVRRLFQYRWTFNDFAAFPPEVMALYALLDEGYEAQNDVAMAEIEAEIRSTCAALLAGPA